MSHKLSKGPGFRGRQESPKLSFLDPGELGQLWVVLATTVALFISVVVPD